MAFFYYNQTHQPMIKSYSVGKIHNPKYICFVEYVAELVDALT